jgi:cytoskeletal protein CcmA (bactofilin family)
MKNYMRWMSIALLAVLLIVPLRSASASNGAFDGKVVFGQSFTLKSGQTVEGDLLVFGGSATIEEGATVTGSAVVFGSSLTVDGEVKGDAAVFGGTATLGKTAHVYGSLSVVGSTLDRAEGAMIDGDVNNADIHFGNNSTTVNPPVVIPPTPLPAVPHVSFGPIFTGISDTLGQAVFLALLAMLLMLFLAPHADRVAHAAFAQPLTAGGLGLLTIIVLPIAVVLSVVTIILIPLAPIIILALVVAAVFGWIAIGYEIGQRFTKAIHHQWHPAFSAGLGTFALTLVANGLTRIWVLNCVGWLVPFLLGLAAIGAVLMTRFGTQAVSLPGDATAVTPVPPAS